MQLAERWTAACLSTRQELEPAQHWTECALAGNLPPLSRPANNNEYPIIDQGKTSGMPEKLQVSTDDRFVS
jgi:hypothetical protein